MGSARWRSSNCCRCSGTAGRRTAWAGDPARQVAMLCLPPGARCTITSGCRASRRRWNAPAAITSWRKSPPAPSQNWGTGWLTGNARTRCMGVFSARSALSVPTGFTVRTGLPSRSSPGTRSPSAQGTTPYCAAATHPSSSRTFRARNRTQRDMAVPARSPFFYRQRTVVDLAVTAGSHMLEPRPRTPRSRGRVLRCSGDRATSRNCTI